MITSYSAYCRKVDEFCYGRCEEAAVTASKSGSSLIEDIWNAIDTDAFRQVREQAIAKNDEEIIREWMRSKPRADRPDHSLYEEYEELVQTYDEARRLFKQADIYIQYMVNGAVYMLVDPEGNLFSIGSKEDILPEFAGYKDNESIPPTVYR
jgi:hypothetical protein